MVKLGRWGIVLPPTPALDLVLSTTLYVLVPLLHVSSSTNYPTLSRHIKSLPFLPENPLRKAFLLHSDGRFSIKTNSLLWPSEAVCNLTSASSPVSCRTGLLHLLACGHHVWSLKQGLYSPQDLCVCSFCLESCVPRLSRDLFLPMTDDSAQMLPFHSDFPCPTSLSQLPVTMTPHSMWYFSWVINHCLISCLCLSSPWI